MIYRRLDFSNSEEFEAAWRIYEENFPQYERRRLDTQLRAGKDEFYRPMILLEREEIIGIMFYWAFEEFTFLEHFAVDEKYRGSGFGSRILREFCEKESDVVLEIDPLESEIAVRRKQFYERLGFCLNDYDYTHPGYETDYPEHRLMIMSLGKKLDESEYKRFVERRDNHTLV